jgi:hypothetical protein
MIPHVAALMQASYAVVRKAGSDHERDSSRGSFAVPFQSVAPISKNLWRNECTLRTNHRIRTRARDFSRVAITAFVSKA